jgi:glutamine synthetase
MMETVAKLGVAIGRHDFSTPEEHMQFCAKTIRPLMDEIRQYADALEGEIADELWPYPTYQEMLFIK